MKFLCLMNLLLLLIACGKESKTNSSSTQLSVNGLQLTTARLYIPAQGMVGGGPSLKINGTDYRIDSLKSDSMVNQYVAGLSYGQISVTPRSSSQSGKEYNAAYSGKLEQGACMSNPMATCTNAVLTQLVAY